MDDGGTVTNIRRDDIPYGRHALCDGRLQLVEECPQNQPSAFHESAFLCGTSHVYKSCNQFLFIYRQLQEIS